METIHLVGNAPPPYSLLTKMQLIFHAEDLSDNASLHLSLVEGNTIEKPNINSHITLASANNIPSSTSLEALGFLDDLGCPRYLESEGTQIELHDPPDRFM